MLVSEIGFGCMPLSEFYGEPREQAEAITILRHAFDLGISLFDTADMYGRGRNEEVLGKALGSIRQKVCIATKAGITRTDAGNSSNGDPAYLVEACNQSLRRLNTDYIDLFQYHRVDRNVSLDQSLIAFDSLYRAGKIRSIGLSNVTLEQIELARSVVPLSCVQNEASLVQQRDVNSIIPWCAHHNVTYLAYSPLGRGFLAGKEVNELGNSDFRRQLDYFKTASNTQSLAFVELQNIARRKNVSTAAIALAWLRQAAPTVVSIPAATRLEQLLATVESAQCELTTEEWNVLASKFQAANPH